MTRKEIENIVINNTNYYSNSHIENINQTFDELNMESYEIGESISDILFDIRSINKDIYKKITVEDIIDFIDSKINKVC